MLLLIEPFLCPYFCFLRQRSYTIAHNALCSPGCLQIPINPPISASWAAGITCISIWLWYLFFELFEQIFLFVFCSLRWQSHHVDQVGPELTEIHHHLPPEWWDLRCAPPWSALSKFLNVCKLIVPETDLSFYRWEDRVGKSHVMQLWMAN